jgi:hypothetical protein
LHSDHFKAHFLVLHKAVRGIGAVLKKLDKALGVFFLSLFVFHFFIATMATGRVGQTQLGPVAKNLGLHWETNWIGCPVMMSDGFMNFLDKN